MKLYLFFTVFLFCNSLFSQVVSEEEFDGGTTAPTGWTFTSIGGTSTNDFGKTSPSLQFDATNDRIQSPLFTAGSATVAAFYTRCVAGTPAAGDLMAVEYFNGSSWNACTGSPVGFSTTARIAEVTFPPTAVRIRLTYTKSSQNVLVDDFTLLNKSSTCTTSNFLWFSSIWADACDAGTSCEGKNEFLTFQNGSSAVNMDNLEISFPSANGSGQGTTFCGTLTASPCDGFFQTNAGYVSSLNSNSAPCASFFLSPPGNIIPANARVIVFAGNAPNFTYNFTSLCSTGGNYYVIFASNTDCNGRFSNNGSASNRYCSIRNRSTGCMVERFYDRNLLGSSDGSGNTFNLSGTATYFNSGCSSYSLLPLELLDFSASKNNGINEVKWKVSKEENLIKYIVEKSIDGIDFETFATIDLNENNTELKNYSVNDNKPFEDLTYYRLSSKEKNGNIHHYQIISVDEKNSGWDYYYYQNNGLNIEFKNRVPENANISVIDISGKCLINEKLTEIKTQLNTTILSKGIYFVSISSPYKTDNFKIIILEN